MADSVNGRSKVLASGNDTLTGLPRDATIDSVSGGFNVNIAGGAAVLEVNLDLANDETMVGTITTGGTRQLAKGIDDGGGRNRTVVQTDVGFPVEVSDGGISLPVDGT